jgi:predicted RNA binding protein YcfA (HicA-like mRNA interferase family)
MKYSEVARLLSGAGFQARQGKGDHEVWSCGEVTVVFTRTREISPGLVRAVLKAIERSAS